MSKSEAFPQKRYVVEEKHRGEWIPLEGKGPKGEKTGKKIVKITEEEAEIMNIDAEKNKIRYVLEGKKDDSKKQIASVSTLTSSFSTLAKSSITFLFIILS